jgi:predicted nucleic acid-binding Zn ribbon protein
MTTWRSFGTPRSEQEPRQISESLDRVARRLGAPASSTLAVVFGRWEEMVGPEIAAHCKPLSLRDGVLALGVDQPAWASQLRYMTADLLVRLAEGTGTSEVREIHIKVAGDNPRPRSRKGRRPEPL